MEQILLMTLAGSILWTGYYLLERRKGASLTQADRYRLLVLVILTYLVPWVWMKDVYKNLAFLFRRQTAVPAGGSSEIIMEMAKIRVSGEIVMTFSYFRYVTVFAVWIGVAVFLIAKKSLKYLLHKRKLLRAAQNCNQLISNEFLASLQKEYHLWRKIRLVQIAGIDRTVTIGIFRPIILLQDNFGQKNLELILRHEFTHIARRDSLLKMLIELICCIHWFNPLVYSLGRVFERVCETSCDERVVRKCTDKEELVQYAYLVKDSMVTPRWKLIGSSSLSSSAEFAMERVNLIMRSKEIKRFERLMVAGAFAFLVFLDSLTALAYPTVHQLEDKNGLLQGDIADMDLRVVEDPTAGYYMEVASQISDNSVLVSEGDILSQASDVETMGNLCIHAYEDRYVQSHTKNADGSCVVKVYACDYCVKCGKTIFKDLYSTTTYSTCPHN